VSSDNCESLGEQGENGSAENVNADKRTSEKSRTKFPLCASDQLLGFFLLACQKGKAFAAGAVFIRFAYVGRPWVAVGLEPRKSGNFEGIDTCPTAWHRYYRIRIRVHAMMRCKSYPAR
jgi:hypothetical protein